MYKLPEQRLIYHDVDTGGEQHSRETAQISIGHEAADERHHGGDSAPVVDVFRCGLQVLMQHLGEVDDQIGGQAEVAQSLRELDPCTLKSRTDIETLKSICGSEIAYVPMMKNDAFQQPVEALLGTLPLQSTEQSNTNSCSASCGFFFLSGKVESMEAMRNEVKQLKTECILYENKNR